MPEYEPLPEGTPVLAMTSIEHDDQFGNTAVAAWCGSVWEWPLTEAVVEALAEAAYRYDLAIAQAHARFAKVSSRGKTDEEYFAEGRELVMPVYRDIVRAVFARFEGV